MHTPIQVLALVASVCLAPLPHTQAASHASPRSATQATGLDGETRSRVIKRIGSMLEDTYVFPEIAQRCAEHLVKQSAAGAYDSTATNEAFAAQLTEDLQSVSKDLHLRVQFAPQRAEVQETDPRQAAQDARDAQRRGNYGFRKLEILDGNIGYLDLRSFADAVQGRATATAAMAYFAGSDALIFDVRNNGGGSPEMVQLLCSYLFDERTHLNSLYWRPSDTTQEYWTLDEVPGTRMPEVPVYVLTSGYTFSAAEEFSYNLSTQSRAILVGETTGGGAHPGGNQRVGDGYLMFIPSGRAINPITGTNWEGVGVKPDIEVPAANALTEALLECRIAAQEYREFKAEERAGILLEMNGLLDEAKLAYREERTTHGKRCILEALQLALQFDLYDGTGIAALGAQSMDGGATEFGLSILRTNAELHPKVAEAWFRLGEGHVRAEQPADALAAFESCLRLAPTHSRAQAEAARLKKN